MAANGMTFLEMDHREELGFTRSPRSETIFEEVFPEVRKWFPVRAKIEPYHEFVAHNRQFCWRRADCLRTGCSRDSSRMARKPPDREVRNGLSRPQIL